MSDDQFRYRGYMIQLRQEWSNWCASVHPTRSDLLILTQSPLRTLSLSNGEALAPPSSASTKRSATTRRDTGVD